MIGVELVDNKDTREPLSKDKFQRIWNGTKNRGVLFGSGGFYGNVRLFSNEKKNGKRKSIYFISFRY